MPVLKPTLTLEQKQAIRMRRFLVAVLSYVIGASLLAVANAIDFMPARPVAVAVGVMVLVNIVFYALLRSGANLRFADPSLTQPQIYAALTLLFYIIFHMDEGRGLALIFTFIVFQFGVFRLERRQFVPLILYMLAGYALVVNLLMHLRPEAIHSVYLEWFSWLLLALVLPGFGLMGGQIGELRNRLRASHEELSAAFETIQQMATRDSLTGLLNRAALTDGLRHALAQGLRHKRDIALFFMDLDHFKTINDTLGHGAGDRVLCEVAARLRRSVRASDLVARLGGDEFVVVVEDFRVPPDLEVVARKIVDIVGQPLLLDGHEVPMSASVGVAVSPRDGVEVEPLLRNGDAAMYHAKQQGRNRYAMYTERMRSGAST